MKGLVFRRSLRLHQPSHHTEIAQFTIVFTHLISLEQGLSGYPVVVNHTTNGQHGKPSVVEFLQLHGSLFIRRLANRQSHGIKAKIAGNTGRLGKHGFHGDIALVGPEFKDTHPEDDLQHGTGSYGEDGLVGVFDEGHAGERNVLLGHETQAGQHGSAAMLDFGFAEPLDVEELGESKGVKADITDVAVQVLGLLEEGNRAGHFGIECHRGGRLREV